MLGMIEIDIVGRGQMVLEQLAIHLKKRRKCMSGLYFTPYTKKNGGEIKDLTVQRKTQKNTKTKIQIIYLVLGMERRFFFL